MSALIGMLRTLSEGWTAETDANVNDFSRYGNFCALCHRFGYYQVVGRSNGPAPTPRVPGAIYHLTARGDWREDIFADDADRELFTSGVRRVRRAGWLGVSGLLPDWISLPFPGGDSAAQSREGHATVKGIYTRHGHVGHLFKGRYQTILVEKDSYLQALARCVVLNPVRDRDTAHTPQKSSALNRRAASSACRESVLKRLFDPASALARRSPLSRPDELPQAWSAAECKRGAHH